MRYRRYKIFTGVYSKVDSSSSSFEVADHAGRLRELLEARFEDTDRSFRLNAYFAKEDPLTRLPESCQQ